MEANCFPRNVKILQVEPERGIVGREVVSRFSRERSIVMRACGAPGHNEGAAWGGTQVRGRGTGPEVEEDWWH